MCLRGCTTNTLSLSKKRNSSESSYPPENVKRALGLNSESENEDNGNNSSEGSNKKTPDQLYFQDDDDDDGDENEFYKSTTRTQKGAGANKSTNSEKKTQGQSLSSQKESYLKNSKQIQSPSYSAELSYDSDSVKSDFQAKIEWDNISQAESLLHVNGKYMNEREIRKRALEDLQRFPLEQLKVRDGRFFDGECRFTLVYLNLCAQANVSSIQYYKENHAGKQKAQRNNEKNHSQKKLGNRNSEVSEEAKLSETRYMLEKFSLKEKDSEKSYNKNSVNRVEKGYSSKLAANVEKDSSDSALALKELKQFPLEKLVMTKGEFFDRRSKMTQVYLDLCARAQINPLKYYDTNYVAKLQELNSDDY